MPSSVRIPISNQPHRRLHNVCNGYTLHEADDAKRADKLKRSLDDGIVAFAPLIRRLVALRTMRNKCRGEQRGRRKRAPLSAACTTHQRLDVDIQAVRAHVQSDLERYRNPPFQLESVNLKPRLHLLAPKYTAPTTDRFTRNVFDAIVAWYRERLRDYVYCVLGDDAELQKLAGTYLRVEKAPRGHISIVFPVPNNATEGDVAVERGCIADIDDDGNYPLEIQHDGKTQQYLVSGSISSSYALARQRPRPTVKDRSKAIQLTKTRRRIAERDGSRRKRKQKGKEKQWWHDRLAAWERGEFLVPDAAVVKRHIPFFWRTSAVTRGTVGFDEQFVPSSKLPLEQDFTPFQEHIDKENAKSRGERQAVIAFSNPSDDTTLVVPMPRDGRNFATLRDFCKNADAAQKRALSKAVAAAVRARLRAVPKVWVSTHGLGVPYLHVRVCIKPKYYGHSRLASASY